MKGIPAADNGVVPKMTAVVGRAAVATAPHHGKVKKAATFPPPATATPFPARAYSALVRGTITDRKNGSPIAGAVVTVGTNLRVVKTDGFGHYHVSFPVGAAVPIEVKAAGYTGALAMGAVYRRHTAVVNFSLNEKKPGKPGIPVPPQLFGHP